MWNFPIPAHTLLLHAPPMLCIDFLLSASDTEAEAEVTLAPGHVLLHQGILTRAGYVELAAQTVGALQGYGERIHNLPVRKGFLATAQGFSVSADALEGDVLRIFVTLITEISGVSLIEGTISRLGKKAVPELLAHGRFKVFVPEYPLV